MLPIESHSASSWGSKDSMLARGLFQVPAPSRQVHKINGHWWVGIPISMRQINSGLFNHSVHLSSTPPCPEKYGALHGLGRATAGSYNPTKFSEVWAVASRHSLYRILTTSVALGTRLRAKSSSQAPIYVPGWGREGKLATVNFRELHFHALG